MNERYQRVLEYPKILNRLAGLAVSAMGKERALALRPSGDFDEVRRLQAQTEEASSVIAYTGGNPMSEFDDVREYLKLSTVGATLSMKALLSVAGALRACRTVRKALVTEREDTPILTEMGSRIASNRMLEEDITNAIISEDEMSDHASPELYDIRRHIRVINDRVRDKLNSYIRSASTQKYLMDSIITMRNGRYVIPVKAEYRQQVPGLVHDQSGSGSTLFIEPMAIVEAGNELKEWTLKERQEMEKILKDFSARIAPDAPMIASSLGILADLDCVFARAYLAREMNAVEPKLNADGRVNLIHARHPLIDPEKVVPSNLWMGEDFTTLVITGPNTGGKTVTLKTVGLLTLMAQSGMQIPAQFGSEIAVFDEVFADIGDEQSIEQSLSTFSSHMTNIVEILKNVTPRSLVLFDELGAGTDPTEGAALAQSILSSLLERKVRTMATTHYSELKAFALSTPGVENASVEFDVESLRPTYRLSIGIPGKSNAFDISRKLGLPERLIDGAKELLSKEDIRFEDVIANAEYHRQIAEREREIAEETRRETVKLRDEAERLRREIEQSRDKSLKKAKDEARRVLENARREADGIIRELKAMKKQAQTPEHEVQRLKKRMEDGIDALSEGLSEKSSVNFTPPKSVRPGDTVEIVHLGTKGTVLSPADRNGEVQIQAGIIKMKAHISQLRLVEPDKPKQSRVMNRVSAAKPAVPMEVDVRGMTLDEAIAAVDIYLADATLAGLNEVSIIHGKGTGVLRTGIQRHLRTHMNVKKYRDGMYGEGEQGVTVVTLK